MINNNIVICISIYLYNILGFVEWSSSFPSIRPVKRPSKFFIPEEEDDGTGGGRRLILYIKPLRPSVCLTRRFCVLIHRQNRPGQPDGRTDSSLISLCVSGQSVCDGGYQGWYSWLSYISVVLKQCSKYPPRTVWNPAVLWSFSPTQTGGSFWFC
jgi:hypothetical protein